MPVFPGVRGFRREVTWRAQVAHLGSAVPTPTDPARCTPVRATTSFNKMLTLPALTVVDVSFEDDWVVLSVRHTRSLLRCQCGWSTHAVHSRSVRRWRHLDAFGMRVVLEGEIRRLRCRACATVVTEDVPWAHRAARHTREFENVVAWWTQRSDRTTVATASRVDWMTVTAIVNRVVAEQLLATRFDSLSRIGVDEIAYAKGHQYLTVVVDHDEGTVVWVGEGKNADTLVEFYELLGKERCAKLTAVSMDMGRAYPAATRTHTSATICWDPFHVVKLLNKAVTDTLRWSKLTKKGLPLSKTEATNLRWALLKKPSDLTDDQAAVLARHQRKRHAIWRAQQLKEDFRGLYQLDDPNQAADYLTRWLSRASRSRIPPWARQPRWSARTAPASSPLSSPACRTQDSRAPTPRSGSSTTGATATTARKRSPRSSTCAAQGSPPACHGSPNLMPGKPRSHQPRKPAMHGLGSDPQRVTDPSPRPSRLPGSSDTGEQLLVQQLLQPTYRLQTRRRIAVQQPHQLDHLVMSLHARIIANPSQKPQESRVR